MGRSVCWLVGVTMEGKLEKVTGIGSTYTRLPSAVLDVFEILGLRYTAAPFPLISRMAVPPPCMIG